MGADLVVLAVPGLLVEQITRGLGDLSGKIIIDPTNALVESDRGLAMGVATSNAELIQAVAPGAHVVKAFSKYRTSLTSAINGQLHQTLS
jgi:predicted dinucleotide-binding enzyme